MKAGERVREFRRLNGLKTQQQLVEHLERNIGLKVSSSTVGRWENDQTHTPERVIAYLEGRITDDDQAPPQAPPEGAQAVPPPMGEDLPPGSFGDETRAQEREPIRPLQITSQLYEKACVDLWDMIGFGFVVAGQGLGRRVIYDDGLIIQANKQELGRAYGKLAEQNETFRRVIVGMTQGGVWVEVVGVTVKLGMQLAQNHQRVAQQPPPEPEPQPEPEPAASKDGAAAPHQQAA
jgi:transcriptional regulator with XRE-family HTH domain